MPCLYNGAVPFAFPNLSLSSWSNVYCYLYLAIVLTTGFVSFFTTIFMLTSRQNLKNFMGGYSNLKKKSGCGLCSESCTRCGTFFIKYEFIILDNYIFLGNIKTLPFPSLCISSRSARFVINVYAQPGPWVNPRSNHQHFSKKKSKLKKKPVAKSKQKETNKEKQNKNKNSNNKCYILFPVHWLSASVA